MTNRMTKQTLLQCVNALLKTGYNTQGRYVHGLCCVSLPYICSRFIFWINTVYSWYIIHCMFIVYVVYPYFMYVHGTSCVSNSMNMLADLDLYWSQGQFTVITKEFKKWYQKPIFILDIFFKYLKHLTTSSFKLKTLPTLTQFQSVILYEIIITIWRVHASGTCIMKCKSGISASLTSMLCYCTFHRMTQYHMQNLTNARMQSLTLTFPFLEHILQVYPFLITSVDCRFINIKLFKTCGFYDRYPNTEFKR